MEATTTTCSNCKHNVDVGDTTTVDANVVCYDCAVSCANCSDIVLTEDATWSENESEYICDDCIATFFTVCEDCSDYVRTTETVTMRNPHRHWRDQEYYICQPCYEDGDYGYCEGCDQTYHWDYLYGDDYGSVYCESCRSDYDSENIHDYSYRPRPEFHSLPGEDTKLYLGVELEVEGGQSAPADIYDQYPTTLYCKHDGSLNDGYEVVSHPLSYRYWADHNMVEAVTSILRSAGARSFQTSTCGMHIHMSRNAFSNAHMWKFIQFMYRNADAVQVVAQRKNSHWARFTGKDDGTYRQQVSKDSKRYGERYVAINLNNDATIELRFFKGTLKPQGVRRNIEFAHAVYAYTEQLTYATIREADGLSFAVFLTWLEGTDDYLNLKQFVTAKRDKLTEPQVFDKAPKPLPYRPRRQRPVYRAPRPEHYQGCGDYECCPW